MTTPVQQYQVGDTYTDRYGLWVVTWVARDDSGFESEPVR